MTAAEVKRALYARHHASGDQMPGAWTCVEEWRNIDLLAFSAWSSTSGGAYARVGYEVKVSRSDLRGELLKPSKRAANVEWCNEFYFAVPAGLLTPYEETWEEPEWEAVDFLRTPCRYSRGGSQEPEWRADPGSCHRGRREGLLIGPMVKPWGWDEGHASRFEHRPSVSYRCDGCGGKGHEGVSRVERDAPTCWVPADVGLITVTARGTKLVKKAPRRKNVPQLSSGELGQLVRFVSMRPDPRHHARNERHVAARAAA